MVTKNKNIISIRDSISIGSFTYKLTKEQREFLKSKTNQEDLACKYVLYQVSQTSKGYTSYIDYNDFSKLYVKSRKVENFKELEAYNNKLVLDVIYKLLSVYLDWLKEQGLIFTIFKNSISPNQKIKIRFLEDDKVKIEYINNIDIIKRYNKNFDIVIGKTYNYLELVYKLLEYHFYPYESEIFVECRNTNSNYYNACSILYEYRNDTYTVI